MFPLFQGFVAKMFRSYMLTLKPLLFWHLERWQEPSPFSSYFIDAPNYYYSSYMHLLLSQITFYFFYTCFFIMKNGGGNAASAFPFVKISLKCSAFPAPPEAMTGMETASLTAFVKAKLNPLFSPSLSILVSRISPAPNSCTCFAQSTTSIFRYVSPTVCDKHCHPFEPLHHISHQWLPPYIEIQSNWRLP